MVVGHRYRKGMIVQLAWHKRADDEIGTLEGLVYVRRLVNTPGDWLKVVNIEDPGIFAAIPADRIDRVEVIPVTGDDIAHFHPHLELPALGMRFELLRTANIALAVGRVL